jgi:hypothetical protein
MPSLSAAPTHAYLFRYTDELLPALLDTGAVSVDKIAFASFLQEAMNR